MFFLPTIAVLSTENIWEKYGGIVPAFNSG
jgi:hypothetical protein